MIFVTVGTHEQPFDRLVEYMDKWSENHQEEVIIQTGYSSYMPKNARWSKLFPYSQMVDLVKQARIVITHGGPSSFIMPLQIEKTPIVVPRQFKYGEHINDHQLKFAKEVEKRMGTIIVVEDVEELGNVISNYENMKKDGKSYSNNEKFCKDFDGIVEELFERNKR